MMSAVIGFTNIARKGLALRQSARTSFGVTGIRTESLLLAVSVSGKRDFGARENAQKRPATCNSVVSRERSVAQIPANSGPFITPSGNLREGRTAWWAREDSNLQPDRYERGNFIGSIDKI
jgi:hypothetical protein